MMLLYRVLYFVALLLSLVTCVCVAAEVPVADDAMGTESCKSKAESKGPCPPDVSGAEATECTQGGKSPCPATDQTKATPCLGEEGAEDAPASTLEGGDRARAAAGCEGKNQSVVSLVPPTVKGGENGYLGAGTGNRDSVVETRDDQLEQSQEEPKNEVESVTSRENDATRHTQSHSEGTQNTQLQQTDSSADSAAGRASSPSDSPTPPHTEVIKDSETAPEKSAGGGDMSRDKSVPQEQKAESEGLKHNAEIGNQEGSKSEPQKNPSTGSSTSNSATKEGSTTQVQERTSTPQNTQSNNGTGDTNNSANTNTDTVTPNTPSNEESTTTTTTTTTTLPPPVPVNSNNKKPNVKGDADSSSISSVWVRVPLLIVVALACILV